MSCNLRPPTAGEQRNGEIIKMKTTHVQISGVPKAKGNRRIAPDPASGACDKSGEYRFSQKLGNR